jgi:hypothetical protein
MIVPIRPRSGAPATAGTGVMSRPSKLAAPSSVPIQSTPSTSCAIATTDDCGSPRHCAFPNMRKARVGHHSSAAKSGVAAQSRSAKNRTRTMRDMGVVYAG